MMYSKKNSKNKKQENKNVYHYSSVYFQFVNRINKCEGGQNKQWLIYGFV